LQAGQSISPTNSNENLDFPINPERVAPVLRRLISPTRTRARIYDDDASLILDSRYLYTSGQVLRYDLPPAETVSPSLTEMVTTWFNRFSSAATCRLYREPPGADGSIYPEVMNALTGGRGAVVRVTEKGELIVSVAVPVQRFRAVLGVLLLSTQAGDIDKIVHAERMAIFRVFGVAAMVNIVLSLLLASTIATPLQAPVCRRRPGPARRPGREEIPDFSDRQDEIGNLSVALRGMTNALYDRIAAIESLPPMSAMNSRIRSLRCAARWKPCLWRATSTPASA
jgi:two-component system sensor histidine kinase ChvG